MLLGMVDIASTTCCPVRGPVWQSSCGVLQVHGLLDFIEDGDFWLEFFKAIKKCPYLPVNFHCFKEMFTTNYCEWLVMLAAGQNQDEFDCTSQIRMLRNISRSQLQKLLCMLVFSKKKEWEDVSDLDEEFLKDLRVSGDSLWSICLFIEYISLEKNPWVFIWVLLQVDTIWYHLIKYISLDIKHPTFVTQVITLRDPFHVTGIVRDKYFHNIIIRSVRPSSLSERLLRLCQLISPDIINICYSPSSSIQTMSRQEWRLHRHTDRICRQMFFSLKMTIGTKWIWAISSEILTSCLQMYIQNNQEFKW